jgi:CheY-like chemotaxis protein
MPDHLSDLQLPRPANSARPLSGLTILVVEDSRFACDAIRLLGQRIGARVRRADTLKSARRHLQTYRPGVMICDLGLPDGSGLDFIAEVVRMPFRPSAVLAISGDPDSAAEAVAAGADGFLLKPIERLAVFQSAVLGALTQSGEGIVALPTGESAPIPDPLALRDDLAHAAEALSQARDPGDVAYVARFVRGIARIAHDDPLERAADDLDIATRAGHDSATGVLALAGLVRDRITASAPF